VKVRGGEPIGEFHRLVNPGRYIPWSVQRLTGIWEWIVKDEPPIEEVLPLFARFAERAVLVAHNAPFDLRFLAWEGGRLGLDFSHPSLCTCRLSRRLFGKPGRHGLESLAMRLGLPVERFHRALPDARTTSRLLLFLLKRLEGEGVEVLGELLDYERGKGPGAKTHGRSLGPLESA
jgi:DNA polymerase III epsilon subunit-like protein